MGIETAQEYVRRYGGKIEQGTMPVIVRFDNKGRQVGSGKYIQPDSKAKSNNIWGKPKSKRKNGKTFENAGKAISASHDGVDGYESAGKCTLKRNYVFFGK